ncbi:replication protein A 70 kDa DNA-binding subunit B-like [Silene latifolia]|uniref:replication protein A 70 kDa DNA-binding subunit B-like n=1 Tax=Silene latifolia TaxID=37657 RepID=UPI003D77D9F9
MNPHARAAEGMVESIANIRIGNGVIVCCINNMWPNWNMKPEKKMVKYLNDTVGPHSIRLKVIEKSNTQISPKTKGLNYQRIIFQDEEGGKIRTTLYADEIAAYENIIFDKMEYDICNEKIKLVPEKYRRNADHPYQFSFGAQTIITPVEGCKPPIGPEYISIAAIPRIVIANDRYDVIAVLIHVEELREIPCPDGAGLAVRGLHAEQPLIIIGWPKIATREGEQLKEMVATFPVVGFTSLKPSYHKDFSVATTSATFVKFNPYGEKAEMLRAWNIANKTAIYAKHQQVLQARVPETKRVPTNNKTLRAKKANVTLQDERHWLDVSIPEFDRKDIHFYLGCTHCGTASKEEINVTYNCETCKRHGVTSTPRMTITFEAIDKTGSFMFTAFNMDSEKLLKKNVVELYNMVEEEKHQYLTEAEAKIRQTPVYLQVGPATSLSRNGVLNNPIAFVTSESVLPGSKGQLKAVDKNSRTI